MEDNYFFSFLYNDHNHYYDDHYDDHDNDHDDDQNDDHDDLEGWHPYPITVMGDALKAAKPLD